MNAPRISAHTIPDDPDRSVFKFVIVAAKRARQIQHGPTLITKYLDKRSSRDTYLQRLAARKLIEISGPGEVRAAAQLFEGGAHA
jgi:hypothetical protein